MTCVPKHYPHTPIRIARVPNFAQVQIRNHQFFEVTNPLAQRSSVCVECSVHPTRIFFRPRMIVLKRASPASKKVPCHSTLGATTANKFKKWPPKHMRITYTYKYPLSGLRSPSTVPCLRQEEGALGGMGAAPAPTSPWNRNSSWNGSMRSLARRSLGGAVGGRRSGFL